MMGGNLAKRHVLARRDDKRETCAETKCMLNGAKLRVAPEMSGGNMKPAKPTFGVEISLSKLSL